jgi:hypothetical protein
MRDALTRDPDASYEAALAATEADPVLAELIGAQLGRPARGRPAVVHRCGHGLPTVVRVDPRLEDGTPFPTVFWLSCPLARSAVGRLEAAHRMVDLNRRLAEDAGLAGAQSDAARRYVAFRDRLGAPEPPLPGAPTAGGLPDRVKCLHVHVAHHLATGDNAVGALALDELLPMACPAPCVGPGDVASPHDA